MWSTKTRFAQTAAKRAADVRLALSDAPHKKFARLDKEQYIHPADRRALAALRATRGTDPAGRPLRTHAAISVQLGTALALGDAEGARTLVGRAEMTLTPLAASLPAATGKDVTAALARARTAARPGDDAALAAATARAWTALLHAGLLGAAADARRGDVAAARRWLLVREFRAPTRFSRAGADATLAVAGLAPARPRRRLQLAPCGPTCSTRRGASARDAPKRVAAR